MNYSEIKKTVYAEYQKYGRVTIDNIEEVNDHLLDSDINEDNMEDKKEFFIVTAMCAYMTENDVYDDYFFASYRELNKDYLSERDPEFVSDVAKINEYLRRDDIKEQFYENISKEINDSLNEDNNPGNNNMQ